VTASLDLRLAPAALAAWAAALVVVRVRPGASLVGATLALAVAAGLLVVPARRRWRGWNGPHAFGTVALALVAAAAVAGAGAAQVSARTHGLLPELAAAGASAALTGRVAADPEPMAPAWPGARPMVRWVLVASDVEGPGGDGGSLRGTAVGTVAVLSAADEPDAAVPGYGAVVRVEGRLRPGRPGQRDVALISATRVTQRRAPRLWDAAASRLRDGARAVGGTLPGDAGALLPGVTVGDTTAVPEDLRTAMRAAGLTHLTAVSGAHFALVATLVLAAAAAVRAPPWGQAVAVVLVGTGMLLLVHPEPSVVRAAAMGLVGALGLARGRPARAPAALGTAVVVLLAADPWLGGELGFALSVAATAGLVLLGSALVRRWSVRLGRTAAAALAVPVAAQLACGPLVLLGGGAVSPWGVVANLVAAPAVAPATLLGLAATLLAHWWPGGAIVPGTVAGAACWWIGAVARVTATAPTPVWLSGAVGAVTLVVASLAVGRLLLGRAGRDRRPADPAARDRRPTPPGVRARRPVEPDGRPVGPAQSMSVPSGRLGACLPPPGRPPDRPAVPPAVPPADRPAAATPG
jgi:competence protein ComEC